MKYKIGDEVVVKVECLKSGLKKILIGEPAKDSKVIEKVFPIVSYHKTDETYKIIIDDDISGWIISNFHTSNEGVNKKFLGKKFFDTTEKFIIKKK